MNTRTEVDVSEKPGSFTVSAYPNPSNYEFNLSVTGGSSEKIEIAVSSVDGREVFRANGASNKIYRFGGSFQPGLYIIRVIQGSTLKTIKVIKG